MLDPVAVGLKFGFLIVLYLFLLWVARSALRDLRRGVVTEGAAEPVADYEQATGMHSAASAFGGGAGPRGMPVLRVRSAPGLRGGDAYDVSEGALLGRGGDVDIRLEDSFASARHARLVPQGESVILEDLGSTNGTRLNGDPLDGPQPLHPGDRIQIGDSEFSFER